MAQFGYFEMKEFAEQSDDPRVKAMWKRTNELRTKLALWSDAMAKLEREVSRLKVDRDNGSL